MAIAITDNELWEFFDRGDALSCKELAYAIKQVKAALPLLEARRAYYALTLRDARRVLGDLEDYQRSRKRGKTTYTRLTIKVRGFRSTNQVFEHKDGVKVCVRVFPDGPLHPTLPRRTRGGP